MAAHILSERWSSNGQHWIQTQGERLFATEQIGLLEQLQCRRCGRDFIDIFSTGERQAVFVSILSFWRLSDEVAERWSQPCPGSDLPSDDEDRLKRATEVRIPR